MILSGKIVLRLCYKSKFVVPSFCAIHPSGFRAFSERRLDKENMAGARALLDFVDASPTPFHVVAKSENVLEAAGFKQEKWNICLHQNKYGGSGEMDIYFTNKFER